MNNVFAGILRRCSHKFAKWIRSNRIVTWKTPFKVEVSRICFPSGPRRMRLQHLRQHWKARSTLRTDFAEYPNLKVPGMRWVFECSSLGRLNIMKSMSFEIVIMRVSGVRARWNCQCSLAIDVVFSWLKVVFYNFYILKCPDIGISRFWNIQKSE